MFRGKNSLKSSAPAADAQAHRLRAHVEMLAGKLLPRSYPDAAALDRSADYIRAQFRQSGGRIEDQPVHAARQTFRNVIVSFGPESSERVIVGAHYDAWGGLPGADDNASGTAVLIELAQRLNKQRLNTRVDLVAYTLEEPPFFGTDQMGSAVHAKSLADAKVKVRGMIGLEMVGYFTDEPHSQNYPVPALGKLYPDRGNYISIVGRAKEVALVRTIKRAMIAASDLPVYSINAPASVPGLSLSDHSSYWNEGMMAVMIGDTAFYRNPNYHTAHDTPDTLDYTRMSKVVDQVFAATVELAK